MALARLMAFVAALLTLQAARTPKISAHGPDHNHDLSFVSDAAANKKLVGFFSAPALEVPLVLGVEEGPIAWPPRIIEVESLDVSLKPRFGYRLTYSGLSPPVSLA